MKNKKVKYIKQIFLLLPILVFISCNSNLVKENENLLSKLAEVQKAETEAIERMAQQKKDIAGILEELEKVTGSISLVRNDVERRKLSNVEQINNQIEIIKQRLKQAEEKWGNDDIIANLQKTLIKKEKEIADLKEEINRLETENRQGRETIEEQLRTIKSLQKIAWYKAGEELFIVYTEYQNITTGGWFSHNKDITNLKRMKENKRKLLLRAKACFQEAAKLGHMEAHMKILSVDKELSKL